MCKECGKKCPAKLARHSVDTASRFVAGIRATGTAVPPGKAERVVFTQLIGSALSLLRRAQGRGCEFAGAPQKKFRRVNHDTIKFWK